MSYIVTHIILRALASQRTPLPFAIFILARIFNPLQGLFNVLIYCRPHVSSLRIHNPEYSWLKAFWQTVRTGGDNSSAGQSRRKTRSKQLLERIDRDHKLRMAKIRKAKSPSITSEPRASIATEEPVVEDCGLQCLTPKYREIGGVDDESSSPLDGNMSALMMSA